MNALLSLDRTLFRMLNGPAGHHPVVDEVMVACAQYSPVLFAFAVTVAVWHVDRRLGIALLFSLWLSVARVYIGAHYPSDVIGGAVLGAAVSAVAWRLATRKPLLSALDRLFNILGRLHFATRVPDSAVPS